ncbi:hypothetical protein J4407_00450 [Candidatus Pacearchaeota archaeon]|nr:hypothetical protein [Candidatus Pacearchaeota archaeon]
MKETKEKKIREWGVLLLAIATLTSTIYFGIITYDLQQKTTPTIIPNIQISLLDKPFYATYNLVRVVHDTSEEDFDVSKDALNFKITNLGQKDAGYLNFYVKDLEEEYGFTPSHIENLQRFNNSFFQIPFWNRACNDVVLDTKDKNQSYNVAYEGCREIRENLNIGIKNLLLRVDCPFCFDKNSQCYPFKICIYSSNSTFCGNKGDYFDLKPESCPEDW